MISLTKKIERIADIDGTEYEVNTSFDNIIDLFEIINSNTPDFLKIKISIKKLINTNLDMDLESEAEVFKGLLEGFVLDNEATNQPVDLEGNPMPIKQKRQYYSFIYDADLIYAGFMQAYGIDLEEQKGKLEWVKIKALLAGLPNDTRFKEVVDIRKRPYPKGKGTGEQRAELKRLKQELS